MAHERLKPSYTFDEDRIKALKKIAPEAFADGKINWEVLKESLGDYLEEEDTDTEHFGLFWPGKREARRLASIPSKGTLIPVYGEGLKSDGTPDTDGFNDSKNIFIEGENLEVLKILQKSYAGKIKMIYIDPPYNTGNDFIYDDDFTEPLETYLRRTGQIDEEGVALTTNKRSDGRFHSKWLSMMYPRLRLARNLLKDDGVIFVSIDDNEVEHLRLLLNEIFGEENFIDQICWKNKYGAGAQTRGFISVHEYILCYSKAPLENIEAPLDNEGKKVYKHKDENFETRGGYMTQPLMTNSLGDRPNLMYEIEWEGNLIKPRKQWVWEKSRLLKAIEDNQVVIKKKKDGSFSVRSKQYLRDKNGKERKGKPLSVLIGPYTQEGTKELKKLFNGNSVFDFPKPSELIKYFFSFTTNSKDTASEDIYLDFFAGSGTSAQSIFQLNYEDKGNRKFICVQMPSMIEESTAASKSGYKNIAELSRERIRRASSFFRNKGSQQIDFGFKVFSLSNSHLKPWQNVSSREIEKVENLFSRFETPIVENWTETGLLSEIILIEGFPLDSQIITIKSFQENKVQKTSSNFHKHSLLICLDDKIADETIEQLDLGNNDIFICLDSAIGDQDKLRLSDKGLIKTI